MHEGAGQAAAGSSAATVMPGDEVGRHAAAAKEDLGAFALAGAATVEEYNLNFLHDESNSHGWVADAATDLHEDLGWAGAATVEEFSVSPGMYYFNTLHGLPNSHGGAWQRTLRLRVSSARMLSGVVEALPVSWGTLVALLLVAQIR